MILDLRGQDNPEHKYCMEHREPRPSTAVCAPFALLFYRREEGPAHKAKAQEKDSYVPNNDSYFQAMRFNDDEI